MSNYLDEEGLEFFWNTIKDYVDSKEPGGGSTNKFYTPYPDYNNALPLGGSVYITANTSHAGSPDAPTVIFDSYPFTNGVVPRDGYVIMSAIVPISDTYQAHVQFFVNDCYVGSVRYTATPENGISSTITIPVQKGDVIKVCNQSFVEINVYANSFIPNKNILDPITITIQKKVISSNLVFPQYTETIENGTTWEEFISYYGYNPSIPFDPDNYRALALRDGYVMAKTNPYDYYVVDSNNTKVKSNDIVSTQTYKISDEYIDNY